MRVAIILFLLVISLLSARASHIVGGEMALVHVPGSSYTYKLELILYYDFKNGLTGGDPTISVRIFRKRDHQIMLNLWILRTVSTVGVPVEYFQPECSDGSIETNRVFYESDVITLSPSIYNDPDGYYISWERCCRNYQITNIFSDDPNQGGVYSRIAGQMFYLEFPPVIKDNEPFINSSPRLFPPLSDYACPNRPYFVDFGGTDPDGDSLVYSIVTPLNSKERFLALPPGGVPNPGPYDGVSWKPGFGVTNIMNGSPDLRITDDGLLTVTPSSISAGLYVFAVKCEEYRDGVKIGEVRRDFQMLVLGTCPAAEPPQIVGRKKGAATFTSLNQTLSVSFSNVIPDGDRCIEVRVSDPDSEKFDDNFQEKVSISVFPLNFKGPTRFLNQLISGTRTATLVNGSVVDFEICFPECSYVPGGGTYQVGIIVFDDACTLPLSDTLVVNVFIEPPPNSPPQFTTPNQFITLNEGDAQLTIPIQATDADLDQLDAFFITDGFILAPAGMSLSLNTQQPGLLTGAFTWDPYCDIYDFTQRTKFNLKVLVEDRDKCLIKNMDTLVFDLTIILPGNNLPVISSSLQQGNEKYIELTRKIYDTVDFTVTGTDADDDFIFLALQGTEVFPAQLGINFAGAQGNGFVTSPFSWYLDCDKINLTSKSTYDLQFIVVDNANKCRLFQADTLFVTMNLLPPDNLAPQLVVESLNSQHELINNSFTAIMGSEIRLKLTGMDTDTSPQDIMQLKLTGAIGNVPPAGYSFPSVDGKGSIESTFAWTPDCSIFQNGIYENQYTFEFVVDDNRCYTGLADTVEVNITVKDVESSKADFVPPNIITPNGDEWNQFFAMIKMLDDGSYVSILPADNCIGQFVNIRIYDRWGKQVYESYDRDFRWNPSGISTGVYFYYLVYTHKQYKGTVSVKY